MLTKPLPKTNNSSKTLLRILIAIAIFLSAILMPWWVTVILAVISVLMNPAEEIILVGLLVDVLYGAPFIPMLGIEFAGTILACALYLLGYPLRSYTKQLLIR